MKPGIKRRETIEDQTENVSESRDKELLKLKKKDILEIMLRQGEEIDELRARVAELEAELEKREFDMRRVGSIAEASLQVTNIFEEAEKAAKIYLENIRRQYVKRTSRED